MATVHTEFDPRTWTLTYVVFDEATKDAVIIDPVLDYDPLAVSTSTDSVDKLVKFVEDNGLNVKWVLETHAHADHLTGAAVLKDRLGAKVGIGSKITAVQEVFKGLFHLDHIPTDGSPFDALLEDGDELEVGSITVKTIHTPGHTPACVSYVIDDAVFTGDALFMPDFGTGRCDFPKGSAEDLYESIHEKLYKLPDDTKVYVGHDYQPGGRELAYQTTIAESKASNIQLKDETSREQFVQFRTARDAKLRPPALIFQSLQVNAVGGALPPKDDGGMQYLKLPMNVF